MVAVAVAVAVAEVVVVTVAMAVVEAEAAAVVVVLSLKVSVFQAFLTFTQKLFAFILYKKKNIMNIHPLHDSITPCRY